MYKRADVILESLLKRMRKARFWKRESCEALSRTLIDIVIFDLLESNQQGLAARAMSLRGEYPIVTKVPQKQEVFSGNADYVIGYDPIMPSAPKTFESTSIVMEAKRCPWADGFPQAVAYMVGAQQSRISLDRIVDTTYGIVSDGIMWQFLKLNGTHLRISTPQSMLSSSGRLIIYRFVDAIIKASISISPHTTPNHYFPRSSQRWERTVESEIFGTPTQPSGKMLQAGVGVCDHGDISNLEGVEKFEILRPGHGEVEVRIALLYKGSF